MVNKEFNRLYDCYHPLLFQYLFYLVHNREIAEQLVQEVYIQVLNSNYSFEGKTSEKTWLYSIAKQVGVQWIRKHRRNFGWWKIQRKKANKIEFILFDQAILPEEILVQKEEMQQIFQSLLKCTEDEQQVIILRYILGLNLQETADVLGWSERKVRAVQHQAITTIRDNVEKRVCHGFKVVSE